MVSLRRIVLICFFPCMLGMAAEVVESYRVVQLQRGEKQREFFVETKQRDGVFRLEGEIAEPILLFPKIAREKIGPGEYEAAFLLHNDNIRRFPVQISTEEDALVARQAGEVSFRLQPTGQRTAPELADAWSGPFSDGNRGSLAALKKRLAQGFGAGRSSYQRKHQHSAADLRGDFSAKVYPVANGEVLYTSYVFPDRAVVLRHILPGGQPIFSKYVHLGEVLVSPGQAVTRDTQLGTLLDQAGFKKSGFKWNHLHLELRKNFDDRGRASTYSLTRADLDRSFFDPMAFFQEKWGAK